MRIAVFGGSFDPIHIAHVAIVKNALNSLNIDKLIVVPTYLNPFKADLEIVYEALCSLVTTLQIEEILSIFPFFLVIIFFATICESSKGISRFVNNISLKVSFLISLKKLILLIPKLFIKISNEFFFLDGSKETADSFFIFSV